MRLTNDKIRPGTALVVLTIILTLASIGYKKVTQVVAGKDQFERCVEFATTIGNPLEAAEYIRAVCKPIQEPKTI